MNFEDTDFRQETLDIENPYDVKLVSDFLEGLGFDYQVDDVDCSMIVYNLNDEIVGTGSHKGKVLKYVAVAPKFRDSTAFAIIVTHLSDKLLEQFRRVFVFTKPSTAVLFESIGFSLIATAEPLFSVLEFGYKSIKDYQEYLKNNKIAKKTDKIASIVVNCNPFTNGHLFLIEKAAAENDILYLFVVETDKSAFPFQVRWDMIKKGVSHLSNVRMLKGGQYIVSGAIFPNYFLKNESFNQISQKQADLDISIFAKYFVPILNIKKRYIGTENYCKTTSAYNDAMHRILPNSGVEVIEIKRIAIGVDEESNPNFISASKIRNAIKNDDLVNILDFLPEVTKDFLLSEESLEIRQKIIQSSGRH